MTASQAVRRRFESGRPLSTQSLAGSGDLITRHLKAVRLQAGNLVVIYHRDQPEFRTVSERPLPNPPRHAPSSRARVRLNGTAHYVGPWPAGQVDPPAEARRAYDELMARWLAG